MFFYRCVSIVLAVLVLVGCGTTADRPPSPTAGTPPASTGGTTQTTAPATPTQVATPGTTAVPSPIPPTSVVTTQPTSAGATATSQPATHPVPATPTSSSGQSFGSEILFLRQGVLWAFDIEAGKERTIVEGVRDFAVAPDNTKIALVRGSDRATEVWLVQRDGSGLTQLTRNDRSEAMLSWAPDGSALIFGSAATDQPYMRDWASWSNWCKASEVHLLDLAGSSETSLATGCDPTFSSDGKRIAYASPPTASESGLSAFKHNTIRLINRQGQNGWDFAKAQEAEDTQPHSGLLVYAPAWSPDGRQVVYHRFIGYRALVDISLSEIGGSLEGKGQLLYPGAGWLYPARFSPDGKRVAIIENNYSDARGFGGYDNWSVSVIGLEGSREVAMPYGTVNAIGRVAHELTRGQTSVWAPDGGTLAVLLPPDWRADLPRDEPIDAGERPGEVWRWRPGGVPEQRLFRNVDFASPLAWLPPTGR